LAIVLSTTPYLAALASRRPGEAGIIIVGRPHRPSSIVAPNRNREKEIGNVAHQPQRRLNPIERVSLLDSMSPRPLARA
jgi:hypothetical protein